MSLMRSVFSDDAWSVWEPLMEAVCPKGKSPLRDLRQSMSAIFCRNQSWTKWRSIALELG